MGIFDFFRRTVEHAEVVNEIEDGNDLIFAGPMFARLADDVDSMSVGDLWRTQPHLRTVTTFIARQISSVSVHVYRREEDGGRVRVRTDDPEVSTALFSGLMRRANDTELMQDLLQGTILDYLLYDEFIWIYVGPNEVEGRPSIRRIMPSQVTNINWEDEWTMKSLEFRDVRGRAVTVPADQVIRRHGWDPATSRFGSSPVTALRETLKEQLEAASYRAQLWKRGPRLGGVITRPANANWDAKARQRFQAAWRSQYSGRGSGAGGTPVLEDGMDFKPAHLKAQDEQVEEMTKLSLATVAQVYHVNPTMVGLLDNANYSNVREFRRSLFGDSLAPMIKQLEGVFNDFLAPLLGVPPGIYAEFNVDEKLRGSFEEQAAIMNVATGGPWMTVNEARSMRNLPAIDGGDDLIRPLNVSTVDQDNEAPDAGEPPPESEEKPDD